MLRAGALAALVGAGGVACGPFGAQPAPVVEGRLLSTSATRLLAVAGEAVLVAAADGVAAAVALDPARDAPAPFEASAVSAITTRGESAAFVDEQGAGAWSAAAGTRRLSPVSSLPAITSDGAWAAYFARDRADSGTGLRVEIASITSPAQPARVILDGVSVSGACVSSLRAVGTRFVVISCAAPDAADATLLAVDPARDEVRTLGDPIAPAPFDTDEEKGRVAVVEAAGGVAVIALADGVERMVSPNRATGLRFLPSSRGLVVVDEAGALVNHRLDALGEAISLWPAKTPCSRILDPSPDGAFVACVRDGEFFSPSVTIYHTDPWSPPPRDVSGLGFDWFWSGDARWILNDFAPATSLQATPVENGRPIQLEDSIAVRPLRGSRIAYTLVSERGQWGIVYDLPGTSVPYTLGPVIAGQYAAVDETRVVWIAGGASPGLYVGAIL